MIFSPHSNSPEKNRNRSGSINKKIGKPYEDGIDEGACIAIVEHQIHYRILLNDHYSSLLRL